MDGWVGVRGVFLQRCLARVWTLFSCLSMLSSDGFLKADSHKAGRAHAAPMPFPCHAVPLRV